MASALDLVFRPLEAQVQDAPGRRPPPSGSGDEFAGILSRAGDSQSEQSEADASSAVASAAMAPSLPADRGLLALRALADDAVLPSPLTPSDTPRRIAPEAVVTDPGPTAANAGGLAPGRELTHPVEAYPELSAPEIEANRLSGLEYGRPAVEPKSNTTADLESNTPDIRADVFSRPEIGQPEVARQSILPRIEASQIAEAPPATAENSETPEAEHTSATAVPTTQQPARPAAEAATSPREAPPPAALGIVANESTQQPRTLRAAHAPHARESTDTKFESDGPAVASNSLFATTSTPGSAAAAVEMATGSDRPVAGASAVATKAPSIASESPAKANIPLSADNLSPSLFKTTPDPFETSELLSASDTTGSGGAGSIATPVSPVVAATGTAPMSVQTTSLGAPGPATMAPSNAILVAAPAEIVGIVSSAADNGDTDRIVIQLDPPELGRVSIDFKFDSNGLQHVTVTGETPDALRQLRLMHFELTQALERHGLGSQSMTFQQQQQNAQHSPPPSPFARQGLLSDSGSAATLDPLIGNTAQISPRTMPGGRLDMKL